MKFVLVFALCIAFAIAMLLPQLNRFRGYIMLAFGAGVFVLSAFQTIRTAPLTVPYYHAREQSFYQSDFAKEKLYPDAILQLLVDGKTVYVKDDLDDYLREHSKQEDNTSYFDDWKYWMYEYYHQINPTEFLEAAGAKVVAKDELNEVSVPEHRLDDFEEAGYANDMYRYLFPLSHLNDEWSNSFFYYWYYSTYIGDTKVYINTEDLNSADELVILWNDEETLYVMSKSYYEEVLSHE